MIQVFSEQQIVYNYNGNVQTKGACSGLCADGNVL